MANLSRVSSTVRIVSAAPGPFLDYKTDRDRDVADGALEVYRRQARLYARMIATAMGAPARAVLMRV